MNNKQKKINKQLSLGFESKNTQSKTANNNTVTAAFKGSILSFPSKQDNISSFRKRIKEDLVRNRVIID